MAFLKLMFAALVLGATAQSEAPGADSNFGVHVGLLKYLRAYYETFTPPFGIIAGKAALFRMAQDGSTRLSVSFGVGLSLEVDGLRQEDLATTEFLFKLHSRPCEESGGPVYQHPYLCPSGCSQTAVDALRGSPEPLELEIRTTVDNTNYNEASVEVTWPVHIPADHTGSLSVVMYDPLNSVPMVCADLRQDRTMEGLIYRIFEDRIDTVPVIDSSLRRDERGFTELSMRAANLRPSFTYHAFVHSLPCVPLSSSAQPSGGDRFMRDISCYGNIGSPGCEAVASNQMGLTLRADAIGISDVSVRFDGLASADAQSILLRDCLDISGVPDPTGVCAGEVNATLMCIDLVDEIPTIDASSTSASPGITTVPVFTRSPSKTPSVSPTPSQATSSPTAEPSEGSGFDPEDKVDVTDVTLSPTYPPFAGKNPCPKIRSYVSGKGGKIKSSKEQLFFSVLSADTGACCFDPDGPNSALVAITLEEEQQRGGAVTNLAGIVAGVAGGMMLTGGLLLLLYRRRREQENDWYAVPMVVDAEESCSADHID